MTEKAVETFGTIGFVGVGALGLPMAARLHRAGFTVRCLDVSQKPVDLCRSLGMVASCDPALLEGCSVVMVTVATGPQLMELIDSELFSSGDMENCTIVIMSTVGPEVVQGFEQKAKRLGLFVVDCPVTGGVRGAEEGSLICLSSGSPTACHRVRGILELLGELKCCGDRVGDGQSVKLVNQMLASIHLVGAAEAIGFAQRLELDTDVVLDVLCSGSAMSRLLAERARRFVQPAQERQVMTRLDIFAKDSGLVANAAQAAGYDARLSEAARECWQLASKMGLSEHDDSSIIEVYLHPPEA